MIVAALAVPALSGAQALPTGWTGTNIGSPLSGTATFSNGVFSVAGAGSDIGGKSDQFMYAHRAMSGDGTLVVNVSSLQGVTEGSRAGIMIRESLTANARFAFVSVTPARGISFQRRTKAGGQAVSNTTVAGVAPVWLKLQRQGSTFTAFQSADGVTWTVLTVQDVPMNATVYAGLAVTSGSASQRALASFVRVDELPADTAPANEPPSVTLSAPFYEYAAPAAIALSAAASDPDGSVARVDFYQGSTLLGSDTSAPFSYTWNVSAAGVYSITAVARDNSGAAKTSNAISVTVVAAVNQPPAVSLTSPAAGATFTAPASIAIAATATDADGTIARVDFYQGTSLIASDTSSPYAITWSNVAAGTYDLIAVARDDDGGTTVSSVRTVQVTDPQVPGRAVFTASKDHATLVDRYLLEVFVAGSDPAAASPMATRDLGKPAVVNGECAADIASTVMALAPGSYVATVTAIGPGGSARSPLSAAFTR